MRLAPNTLQPHTHVQPVARCLHVDGEEKKMDLDRGTLARIDRMMLS